MSDDHRVHLLALATALPAGSAVPVPREWLLALLKPAAPSPVPTTAEPAHTQLLTVQEVAERFSLSRDWLYRHWRQIPGAVKLGRKVLRFPATALPRYLASLESRRCKPS